MADHFEEQMQAAVVGHVGLCVGLHHGVLQFGQRDLHRRNWGWALVDSLVNLPVEPVAAEMLAAEVDPFWCADTAWWDLTSGGGETESKLVDDRLAGVLLLFFTEIVKLIPVRSLSDLLFLNAPVASRRPLFPLTNGVWSGRWNRNWIRNLCVIFYS